MGLLNDVLPISRQSQRLDLNLAGRGVRFATADGFEIGLNGTVFEAFGANRVSIQSLEAKSEAEAQEVQGRIDQQRVENSSRVGLAEAEARAILGEAEAEGERLMVEAFGDPHAYSLWRFASGLKDGLEIDLTESTQVWKELAKRLAVGVGSK